MVTLLNDLFLSPCWPLTLFFLLLVKLHFSDSPGAPRTVERLCSGETSSPSAGLWTGGERGQVAMGRRRERREREESERRRTIFKPDLLERKPTAVALKFNMRRQTLGAAPCGTSPCLTGKQGSERGGGGKGDGGPCIIGTPRKCLPSRQVDVCLWTAVISASRAGIIPTLRVPSF